MNHLEVVGANEEIIESDELIEPNRPDLKPALMALAPIVISSIACNGFSVDSSIAMGIFLTEVGGLAGYLISHNREGNKGVSLTTLTGIIVGATTGFLGGGFIPKEVATSFCGIFNILFLLILGTELMSRASHSE